MVIYHVMTETISEKIIMIPCFYVSLFLKWMRWYFTYLFFLYRVVKCPEIEDYRFCKRKEYCFFPFRNCNVTCKDCQDNKVIIKPYIYERLYNLGVYGDASLNISTIKRYCSLPNSVSTIHCQSYPWEFVKQNTFTVNGDLFIPKNVLI